MSDRIGPLNAENQTARLLSNAVAFSRPLVPATGTAHSTLNKLEARLEKQQERENKLLEKYRYLQAVKTSVPQIQLSILQK